MLAKLIFLGVNAIFNFLLMPLITFGNQENIFIKFNLFLTIINYTICTIYFCGRFIYELLLYLNRNDEIKSEKIKKNLFFILINNFYLKFIFSLCITVNQIFWLFFSGEENLMDYPADFIIFLAGYLQFLIGVGICKHLHLLDIGINRQNYIRDFFILCFIKIFYTVLFTILMKLFNGCVIYPFLKLEFMILLGIYIVIFFALKKSYHYYHKRNIQKNKMVTIAKERLNNNNIYNSIDNSFRKKHI